MWASLICQRQWGGWAELENSALGKWSDLRRNFSSHPVIEDLTHKTGNFKQFSIFCNMLESALTQVGTNFRDWRFLLPSVWGVGLWMGYLMYAGCLVFRTSFAHASGQLWFS